MTININIKKGDIIDVIPFNKIEELVVDAVIRGDNFIAVSGLDRRGIRWNLADHDGGRLEDLDGYDLLYWLSDLVKDGILKY